MDSLHIPVVERVPLQVRTAPRAAAAPHARWSWLPFVAMGASAVLSLGSGSVLGYLAGTQHGLTDRWTEAVQAHGRLQLVGWAAVFVVALLFEFSVRFNQRTALPPLPRAAALGALGAGPLLGAAGAVWHGPFGPLFPIGAAVTLAGAAGALLLVARAAFPCRLPRSETAWLVAPAAWLVVAVALEAVSAFRADSGVVPLAESRLTTEILMRGFLLQTILAVAFRAFPGHLGTRMVSMRQRQLLWGGMQAMMLGLLLSSGGYGLPSAEPLGRATDFTFAALLLTATAGLGVLPAARRVRTAPRYQILIPLAWMGLVAYAVVLAGAAATPGWGHRTLYEAGAVRHIFLLGFMAPLMAAMAHIVLARFGTGRVRWQPALSTAALLFVAAWPLRVLPTLFTDAPSPAGRNVLGIAATFLSVGLALLAAVCLRNAAELRLSRRARSR